MTEITSLAAQYASTAEFYRNYAGQFEPGSMGYAGNMAEAAKYAGMAERFGTIDPRQRRIVAERTGSGMEES